MFKSDHGEGFTRDLTIRYVAVLVVLGLLAVLSFFGLVHSVISSEGGVAQVNLSGSQRMLVERAAFAANRLVVVADDQRPAVAAMLAETLDRLDERRHSLAAVERPAVSEHGAEAPFDRIDRDLAAFIGHGRAVLDKVGSLSGRDPDLAALSDAAAGPLLTMFEDMTLRVQQSSETQMREVLVLQAAGLLVALGVLLGSAFGVFHPMTLRLRADLAERLRAAEALRDSEERLRRILEESPMGVSVSRRSDGCIVFANSRFSEILGMPREQFVGSFAREHYVDETQRRAVLVALRRDGRIDDAEVEFRRKDGRPFWSLLTIRSTDFESEPVNLAWIYDITDRKAADQQILLAAKVLDTINEAVMITDAANRIVFVNPAFTAVTEYGRDEVVGRSPSMLASGRHDRDYYDAMWASLLTTGSWSGEIWNRRKSGEVFAEWLSIVAIREANGLISHHVAVFTDITHRKEDEARVWRQANYDALTGLPNRSLFLDRLHQAVSQSQRGSKRFALLFLDLDGFKAVNDRMGHAAGDLLLQQAAARLSDCVRASDTLARLAGDEFVVILQGIRSREEPALVAGKIVDVLGRPFDLGGRTAQIYGSVGIAMFPEDAADVNGLIARADEAMYAVKRRGKNAFHFASDVTGAEPS